MALYAGTVREKDLNKSMHSQMADFMSCDDYATKASGVFYDGDAVHFLQPLVHYACATDISET